MAKKIIYLSLKDLKELGIIKKKGKENLEKLYEVFLLMHMHQLKLHHLIICLVVFNILTHLI